MGHAIYLAGYAAMATLALLVILFAQLKRKEESDHPINWQVIKVVTYLALGMWSGVIAIAVAYGNKAW